ncbi:hypothetical protein [Spongiactinospora sp. 9N601]|uniref:hypothetical protein n=1 Tax=Spongiactinospora sp. 9N601 TaxID=3375149 RepID=UPI0037A8FBD1
MMGYEFDERLSAQREAYRALGNLLERTGREELPPISWTISDGGTGPLLVGQCFASDPIQRQQDFYAWQAAIGAEPWPDGIKRSESIHMHAAKSDYDGVTVTLSADISAEEM